MAISHSHTQVLDEYPPMPDIAISWTASGQVIWAKLRLDRSVLFFDTHKVKLNNDLQIPLDFYRNSLPTQRWLLDLHTIQLPSDQRNLLIWARTDCYS
tara:strand:- start:123 stop:416 length:294 start_codon:yes stop_codon:yes gene_type:complete